MGNSDAEEAPRIEFKKKKRKPLRKREPLSDDNDSGDEEVSVRYIHPPVFIYFFSPNLFSPLPCICILCILAVYLTKLA